MSGETTVVWGNTKPLESNGAVTIPNGAIAQAGVPFAEIDTGGYPDAQFVLRCSFAVAPAENGVIALCAQQFFPGEGDLNDAPEVTRPNKVLGTFVVNNVTTPQVLELTVQDIPRNAFYWLYNVNTGQAVAVGWSLKAVPKTYKAA